MFVFENMMTYTVPFDKWIQEYIENNVSAKNKIAIFLIHGGKNVYRRKAKLIIYGSFDHEFFEGNR